MRSIPLLAISLTAGLLLGGCNNGSGLHNTGGTTSAGGGGSGQGGAATGGGGASPSSVLVSGGTQAPAGNVSTMVPASGGATATTSAATGGRAGSVGGSSLPVGGTTKAGGTTARTSTATGGGATGGNSTATGTGGTSTSTGGSSRGGASSSAISVSTSRDAGAGDGGIVASGYCEGNTAKLTTQGQDVTPGVTDFQGNIAMDCCNGYGVNLHSTAALGFDVAIELILSISVFTPGEYEVGGPSSIKARALVFKNTDPLTSVGSVNSKGKLWVFGADGSAGMSELGLCLEVTDTASGLGGTKLYVPRVIIGSYQQDKRIQIFLLKDSTLRAGAVASQALDSLELADYPILDLGRIAYVEKATMKMGFNPGQKYGDSLRTTLGTPLDRPFVAIADGARIYLGSFTSGISSIAPTGPYVYADEITAEALTVRAPVRGTDPRNDERIIKALSERGKLVP